MQIVRRAFLFHKNPQAVIFKGTLICDFEKSGSEGLVNAESYYAEISQGERKTVGWKHELLVNIWDSGVWYVFPWRALLVSCGESFLFRLLCRMALARNDVKSGNVMSSLAIFTLVALASIGIGLMAARLFIVSGHMVGVLLSPIATSRFYWRYWFCFRCCYFKLVQRAGLSKAEQFQNRLLFLQGSGYYTFMLAPDSGLAVRCGFYYWTLVALQSTTPLIYVGAVYPCAFDGRFIAKVGWKKRRLSDGE